MVTPTESTQRTFTVGVDMHAISTRLAGMVDVALCPECELAVTQIAADVVDLLAEVSRLYGAAIVARRESANRLAAIRAALRAELDGEADPPGFLRDEITDPPGKDVASEGRGWCR